jgi:translocation and assembly module TamA
MSFITTRQGLALAILSIALAMPGMAEAVSYEVQIEVPKPYQELLQNNIDIYKWRDNPRLTEGLWRSLYAKAPEQIKGLMATEGYYLPVITSSLEQKAEKWIARFTVVPGESTTVGEVDLRFSGAIVEQDPKLEPSIPALRTKWPLKRGDIFRQAAWESAKRAVLRDLLINRYPTAIIISSQARVDPKTRKAALRVSIDSGPPVTLGSLKITGLERYPPSIIESLNPIPPGAFYSQAQLLEFQDRLQNSLYFRSVIVSAEPERERPSNVPIQVTVAEKPSTNVALGAGYSTNTGVRGQVEYTDLNLFDRGWRFSTQLKLESERQSGDVGLDFPITPEDYLYGLGAGLGCGIGSSSDQREAEGYRYGLAAGIERSTLQNQEIRALTIGGKQSISTGKIECTTALQYIIEQEDVGDEISRSHKALYPNYSWAIRDVDDLTDPRRGYVLTLQAGGALEALLSDADFLRGYARWTGYRSLGPENLFIFRAEVGSVLASSRLGVPATLLFRAGGDGSVRGYDYQSLGIREADAVVGGRYLAVASAEYVRWIVPNWGAAVFYDVGDAFDELGDFKANAGYGVGARWKSPVGPVGLDVAYGEEAHSIRLHFSLGVSF